MLSNNIMSDSTDFYQESDAIESSDGCYKIFLKHFIPNKKSRLLFNFVIVHDLGGYHGRYKDFIKFLMSRSEGSFQITAFDMVGHGHSNGPRAHVKYFEHYCSDLINVINNKRLNNEGPVKTIIFGHGLGGLVILKMLEQYEHLLKRKIDGIILSNPFLKFKFNLPAWGDPILDVLGQGLSKIRLNLNHNGYDRTNDANEAERYNADYLISPFITLGLASQIAESAQKVRSYSYFIDIPSLFLISEESCFSDRAMIELFQKGMPKNISSIVKYQNSKHDILHEVDRKRVFEDVYNWTTNFME